MDADQIRAAWSDASLAAALIAVDPIGLGGACIHGPYGSAREHWLALLQGLLPAQQRIRKVPASVSESRLLGGLDLSATLQCGRPVIQRGLLAEADGGLILLPMAERLAPALVAHITGVLDTGELVVEREGLALRAPARLGVIAFDESVEDERPPAALLDRLAFLLDLSNLPPPSSDFVPLSQQAIEQARDRLAQVQLRDDVCEGLCAAAMSLGIASIRASMMALRAARAIAALDGRTEVSDADATSAAALVLAPRATVLPQTEAEAEAEAEAGAGDDDAAPVPQTPEASQGTAPEDSPQESEPPIEDPPEDMPIQDLILAAAQAAIPRGLLDSLKLERLRPPPARSSGRAGALRQSQSRGRPAGVRRGDPRAGVRLNLVETLKAAAPWQALRRRAVSAQRAPRRIEIRAEDFHITRYKQRTQTTTIFVVDASGSSALNRLAEAKGAVELLLADCYVRRDQVAVIAFRGRAAELLLPPTRSLVRAKRSLAGLPGGGGTPLAAGIDAGLALAEQVRRSGQTPALVLLTDGRANVARDGSANRERGESEALTAARQLRAASVMTLFVDTAARAQPLAERLAREMNARYLPLPYADAAQLSAVVKALAVR